MTDFRTNGPYRHCMRDISKLYMPFFHKFGYFVALRTPISECCGLYINKGSGEMYGEIFDWRFLIYRGRELIKRARKRYLASVHARIQLPGIDI